MKQQNKTRHFYALSCPYGIRAVYNEYNPATLHVFDTKKQRDAFLDDDDAYNPKCEQIDANGARKYIRKNKYIVH
jgi:hypothetical protein